MNMRQIDGGATDPDIGRPFYISSPSSASDKVTVVWGTDAIAIKTPDVDYVEKQQKYSMLDRWTLSLRGTNLKISWVTTTYVLISDHHRKIKYWYRVSKGHPLLTTKQTVPTSLQSATVVLLSLLAHI